MQASLVGPLGLLGGLWPCAAAISEFKTEPLFRTNEVKILDSEVLSVTSRSSSYLFTSISTPDSPNAVPQIYNLNGELVWNGNETIQYSATDLHVCDYLGTSHLCLHDGEVKQVGWSLGEIRFLDSTYTQVGDGFASTGLLEKPDKHELNTAKALRGEAFLQDIFQQKQMDLTPYDGPQDGWILENCIQEVDINTAQARFGWCTLDHLPIWDTTTFIAGTTNYTYGYGGDGTYDLPWDFIHVNSVDKNEEGDYLLSARHLNSILKIAGANNRHGVEAGKILWRLGGQPGDERSDFEIQGFNFSRQHSIRFIDTKETTTTLILLNNADDGTVHTSEVSDGQLIEVNNSTMTARLLRSYQHPDSIRTSSAGLIQPLENGHTWISWGADPRFTEYDTEGKVVFHGTLNDDEAYSPRIWKQEWVGNPSTRPKILAYSAGCEVEANPLVIYVSWNGATEVAQWKVYLRSFSKSPWIPVGRFTKEGFETIINLSSQRSRWTHWIRKFGFVRYVKIEALDIMDNFLSSNDVKTWIPDAQYVISEQCDEMACSKIPYFNYASQFNTVDKCRISAAYPVGLTISLLASALMTLWLIKRAFRFFAYRRPWRKHLDAI